jgi:carbamate kinase
MQDALKLKDAPSNEHVVASYVRTMIDESHKTWDDVMEQVEFVLDLVKEGKTMKAEDVFNIVKSQHMQSYFDYKMSLKENLDTLRNIVKDKAYQTVKFEDGSMKVDLTTASMFLQVFDAQKPETQEKIQAKIKTKQGFLAMLDLIYSKM